MSGQIDIADNLIVVRENIRHACERTGRDPASVMLVAVSKTHPPEKILEAAAGGVQHFGENRVEEGTLKIPIVNAALDISPTWHMIGHIQSRKAKDVVPIFNVIHSVDSLKLASKLSNSAAEHDKTLEAFLEINVSGEESKEGFNAVGWQSDRALFDMLLAEVRQILMLPHLRWRGLMTMAPIVADMEQARPVFSSLRGLRDALQTELNVALPDLSMGMTDDYPVAIEEGATVIRVGRAIFGERQLMQR
jgi:pyridoxal phosphate enzyme (YggS family)